MVSWSDAKATNADGSYAANTSPGRPQTARNGTKYSPFLSVAFGVFRGSLTGWLSEPFGLAHGQQEGTGGAFRNRLKFC